MNKKYVGLTAIICALAGSCFVGCFGNDDAVKLTVWVSEGDRAFTEEVVQKFQQANPDKKYRFTIDAQGENEMATRVLKDVEKAADIFAYPNDQIAKLVNGDALTKIAGERLDKIKAENSADSVKSACVQMDGEESCFGIPYTDNTFFLYYDKSVFSETDVATVDGILAKCGDKKFAIPMTDGWYTTSFYFGKDLGYEVTYDADLAETEITCNFDNETGVAVTNAMYDLVKDNRVKADANDSKITAGFHDKSIVAAVSGIWNKESIARDLGDNFGATKLPTYTLNKGTANEEQVQMVSFAGYKLMGVNNYSKAKADALLFAEFFANEQNQIRHFEMRGFVPTNENARKREEVQADVCAKAITAQLAFSKPQINVPSTLWVPMEGLGSSMISSLSSGTFDVAKQLEACVRGIEKSAGQVTVE